MAIAGVGSVASGLADGLAREGRVILGGDVAFSLSLREASADERAFLDGQRPRVARRHHAGDGARSGRAHRAGRGEGGRCRLSALRHGRARAAAAARAKRWRNATARSAPPPIRRCWRGSISSRARASRSAPPRSKSAPCSRSEPDKLAGGIGFGPRLLISEAALRATGLLQPGSVVRWHYRLRLPDNDATDAAVRARARRPRRRNCRKPAGKSARAPMPRPRSSATSSASRSISPWSGSPRCWSAASASRMRSRATSTAGAR